MKQNVNICILRIIATVSVVLLHTCSTLTDNLDIFSLNNNQIKFYNVVHYILNWAVPCFFMITGYLLLSPNKKITYGDIFKKYCFRIVLALFIFGAPFALLIQIMNGGGFDISYIYNSFVYVVQGKSFSHLWYLYDLIGIYLVLPVLKSFVKSCENNIREFDCLLIALAIFDYLLPLISYKFNIAFNIPFKYTLLYVLLGYRIRMFFDNKDNKISKKISILLCFLFAISACTIVCSVLFDWNYSTYFVQYNSPLVLAVSVFMFYVCCMRDSGVTTVFIWKIDRLCFGVYLIHPLFIQFVYKFLKITPITFDYYIIMTFLFAATFALVAFIASWVVSRIKIMRRWVL